MKITTGFDFEGYIITEHKGLVRGITVRSPTIAQGLLGGLKSIIGVRYDSSEVGAQESATEVLCYGTAVTIQPKS